MPESRIIYPGTFDPITNGHVDLIKRASTLFDHVVVAIATNPVKKPLFAVAKRIALVEDACAGIANVSVLGFDCLLTEFATQQNARLLLRGLRAVSDFEFEFQLASMNRRMKPDCETLFLTADEQYAYISSSLVREIAHYGGDVSPFVPAAVGVALAAERASKQNRVNE